MQVIAGQVQCTVVDERRIELPVTPAKLVLRVQRRDPASKLYSIDQSSVLLSGGSTEYGVFRK